MHTKNYDCEFWAIVIYFYGFLTNFKNLTQFCSAHLPWKYCHSTFNPLTTTGTYVSHSSQKYNLLRVGFYIVSQCFLFFFGLILCFILFVLCSISGKLHVDLCTCIALFHYCILALPFTLCYSFSFVYMLNNKKSLVLKANRTAISVYTFNGFQKPTSQQQTKYNIIYKEPKIQWLSKILSSKLYIVDK